MWRAAQPRTPRGTPRSEVDFDTLEDVARYRDDPRHKKVSALCKSIRTDRVSIDIRCERVVGLHPALR